MSEQNKDQEVKPAAKFAVEVNGTQLPFHEFKVSKGKVTGRIYYALDKELDAEEGMDLLLTAYGKKVLWDNIVDSKYRQACSNWSKQALDEGTGEFSLEEFTDMVQKCSARAEKIAVIRDRLIELTKKMTKLDRTLPNYTERLTEMISQMQQLQIDLDKKSRKGGDDNDGDEDLFGEENSGSDNAQPAIPGRIA
jgi:hypothetical protein